MHYYSNQFAANYDCNAYGAGNYDAATCTTSSDSGGLLPTGDNMAVGLVGGILLIVIAVVLFITTRRSKKVSK